MEQVLLQTLKEELLLMMARQLDYSPKAEDLPRNCRVMCKDLMAIGLKDADAARVRAAMQKIAIDIGRWPTAYMIRNCLPASEQTAQTQLPPPMPPAIRQWLVQNGLDKRADETSDEYKCRCLEFMKGNSNGVIKDAVNRIGEDK